MSSGENYERDFKDGYKKVKGEYYWTNGPNYIRHLKNN